MGLKEYKDNWETWSKGKKVVSVIVGCCILTFVFAMICGMLVPDANDTDYDDESYDDNYTDPFDSFFVKAENISVVSSRIDITHQEIESTDYAYFYQNGNYAEAAYYTNNAEDFNIVLNLNKIKLSEDSELDFSTFDDSAVYNKSNVLKDISKILKDDDAFVSLSCYDKNDGFVESFSNLDYSLDDGILTVTYSNSSTSDYHGERNTLNDEIDHANIVITGRINVTGTSYPADFQLTSKDMDVNFYN